MVGFSHLALVSDPCHGIRAEETAASLPAHPSASFLYNNLCTCYGFIHNVIIFRGADKLRYGSVNTCTHQAFGPAALCIVCVCVMLACVWFVHVSVCALWLFHAKLYHQLRFCWHRNNVHTFQKHLRFGMLLVCFCVLCALCGLSVFHA